MMRRNDPFNHPPMTQADLLRNGTRIAQRELKSSRDVSLYRSPDSPNKLKVVDWPGIPTAVLSPLAQKDRKLNKARKYRSRSLDREGRSRSQQPLQTELTTMLNGNGTPQRCRSSSLQPSSYGTGQVVSPSNTTNNERTQQSMRGSRQSTSKSNRSDRRSQRPSSLRSLTKNGDLGDGRHHHGTSSPVPLSPTQNHYKNRRYELRKRLSETMDRECWADYNSSSTSSGDFSGESQNHTHTTTGSWRRTTATGPPPPSPRPRNKHSDRKALSSIRRKSSSSPSSYQNRPPRSPDKSGSESSSKLLSLFAGRSSPPQLIPSPPRSPASPKTRSKIRRISLGEKKRGKKTVDSTINEKYSSRNDPALEKSPRNSTDGNSLEFALSSLRISHWD